MKIEFLSTLAVIAPDPVNSRKLYVDALGLPLAGHDDDGYHHTDEIGGCNHFGVWPLSGRRGVLWIRAMAGGGAAGAAGEHRVRRRGR
jgi:hypothetical protein